MTSLNQDSRDVIEREISSSGNDDDMATFLEKVRNAESILPNQKSINSAGYLGIDSINEGQNGSNKKLSKRDLQSIKVIRWDATKNKGNIPAIHRPPEVSGLQKSFASASRRLLKVALVLAWLGLGSIYTLPGVSLIVIACQSCLKLDLVVLSFVCRAFGAMAGVIFMNVIASSAHLLGTILVSTVCVAIATIVIPFVGSLPGLLILMWMLGVVYGVAKQGFQMLGRHLGMKELAKKLTELLFFCIGAILSTTYTYFSIQSFTVVENVPLPKTNQNSTGCQLISEFYCPHVDEGMKIINLYFYSSLPLLLVAILIIICLVIEAKFKTKNSISSNGNKSSNFQPTINRSFIGIKLQMFIVYFLQDGIAYVLGYLIVIFVYLGKLPETSMPNAVLACGIYWVSYCIGSVIVMGANHFIYRNEKLYIMLGLKSIGSLVCCAIMAVADTFPQFCISLGVYTVCMSSAGEFGVNSIRSRCIVDYRTLTFITNVSTSLAEMTIPYLVFLLMDFNVAQFMTYSVAGLTLAMWVMCKILIFSTISSSSEGFAVSHLASSNPTRSNTEEQHLIEDNDFKIKYTVDGWNVLE